MSGLDKKKEMGMMSEEELIGLLLVEDGRLHDEGKDDYFEDVIAKVRKDLGIFDGNEE